MPTLANINGASLVPDASQGLNTLLQAFGTPQSRAFNRTQQGIAEAELEARTSAPETAGLVSQVASGTPDEQEKALIRLAAIKPAMANSMRQALERGDERELRAVQRETERGTRQAVMLQGEKDHTARVQMLKQFAQESAGRGDQAGVSRIVDLANMDPDRLDLELQRMVVAGTDLKTLTDRALAGPEFAKTREVKDGDRIRTEQLNADGTVTQIGDAPRFNKDAGTKINIDNSTSDQSFGKEFGKQNAAQFFERRASALDAKQSLQSNVEAERLLDAGVITGFGADFKVGFGKALQAAGFSEGSDEIANTEAYVAARASEVGRIIKLFGSGTGLSDADRAFAEKAAGGNIDMTEAAIRRILDINERASRNVINNFNEDADKVPEGMSPFPLRVEAPEAAEQEVAEQPPEVQAVIQQLQQQFPGAVFTVEP